MNKINSQVFDFLIDLENHNDREWFSKNKKSYIEAFNNVESFINDLIKHIAEFDASVADQEAKKCIYRIYRDLRFTPDKRPYKIHFGAYIAMGGKSLNNAGYYVHIQNNMSFLAAGLWCPERNLLKKIRQEIYYEPNTLNNILNESKFKKQWGKLGFDKMKRPPKDYPSDFEFIDLLMYKSFCTEKFLTNKEICSNQFMQTCIDAFSAGQPLVSYMNYIIKL